MAPPHQKGFRYRGHMQHSKTPPATPPGQAPDIDIGVIAAPGIVQGMLALAEAVNQHMAAIYQHAAIVSLNTAALVDLTGSVLQLVNVLEPPEPKKATRITLLAEKEIEETPMPPLQLHPTDKFKVTFGFNGTIDGEPVIVCQVPYSAITQDPKTEAPAADDPTMTKTTCTVHGYCTQPGSIIPGNPTTGGLSCEATVDDPSTGDQVEKIFTMFDDVIQWLPPTQAKATSISIVAEIEL